MNAIGHYVSPFIIFPRKNMNIQLMRGCPPGAEGVAQPSGGIQMNIFTDWFKHFLKHKHPTPESRVLLILDGHFSHTRNINVIDLARENNVDIVSLPPHTYIFSDADFIAAFGIHRSSQGLVSPYDTVPEKLRNTSNRGRKAAVASVITSSPYKNTLIEINKKKIEKENKTKDKKSTQKKRKIKIKITKTKDTEESENEEDIRFDSDSEPDAPVGREAPYTNDASCMFCQQLFSENAARELWVKCLMCNLWAHNDCAGPEFDTWICDFCK